MNDSPSPATNAGLLESRNVPGDYFATSVAVAFQAVSG